MKFHRMLIYLLTAALFLMIAACKGGVGNAVGYGEVIVHLTDARPFLPKGADRATNLWITFSAVSVHKSGDGWILLPLAKNPSHTIDLLQLTEGNTIEMVSPTLVEYGKYTQIRLILDSATIRFDNDPDTDSSVNIPLEYLKIDQSFLLEVDEPKAVDIVIDFDLSKSLIVDDAFETPSFKLHPVLHIVRASEAATINGEIDQGSFIAGHDAKVTVYVPNSDFPGVYEEYTNFEVSESGMDPTKFSIYWLVADQGYSVEIDFDPDLDNGVEFSENVSSSDLIPGEVRNLNMGIPI